MRSEWLLKLLFYVSLLTLLGLLGYKLYLNLIDDELSFVHTAQVDAIEDRLAGKDTFQFAVVGEIKNSVGIFQRQMVPKLNERNLDFVISAGNAVSSNSEAKYRALHQSLHKLEIPYLLTFGEKESGRFGNFRFYERFGPHFYAFEVADSLFLFLDTTGHSSLAWQLRWLERELEHAAAEHVFAFMGHPPLRIDQELLFDTSDAYIGQPAFQRRLTTLLERYEVDAVFSANLPIYARKEHNGTAFVTTGGAGGLVLNTDYSFYHYVRVAVDEQGVTIDPVDLDIGQHPLHETIEGLWLAFHSMVYVGYPNFFLLLSAVGVVVIALYRLLFTERDFYPDFSADPAPYRGEPIRVAMFTNNYLPFVTGQAVSIDRLRRGLRSLGHSVRIFAPRYETGTDHEAELVRVSSLVAFGQRREFRLANLFAPRIGRSIRHFQPTVIHVHNPFWLGTVGAWLARLLRIPLVYTYHTRLEHYAHYVPLPGPLFRNLISHALVKRFANRCDAVIVPAHSAEDYLRMIGVRTPLFVQPTGIDFAHYHGANAEAVDRLREDLGLGDERVLVSVSRLTREKNIDFIIDGICELTERCEHPFRLLIIGDGPERERLQGRIERCGLARHITLVGAVAPETVPLYYALGDVFVFASKSETQGMVILESMAGGLPAVAVRSSGVDDIIREGIDGYKTSENPAHWATRVATLITDDKRHREMVEAAEQRAREFDLQPFAHAVAEVYAYARAIAEQRKGVTSTPYRSDSGG